MIDDWFPGRDSGILGHGHDGLVVDRIKHADFDEFVTGRDTALIAQATLWSLLWSLEGDLAKQMFTDAERERFGAWLVSHDIPAKEWTK
jgi:hypothetical protein